MYETVNKNFSNPDYLNSRLTVSRYVRVYCMKTTVFWVLTLCGCGKYMKLQSVTIHRTVIFIVTAMKTSSLIS